MWNNFLLNKAILLLLLIGGCYFTGFSQNERGWIIIADTIYNDGTLLFSGKTPDVILFTQAVGRKSDSPDTYIKYTADQVTEFGFANQRQVYRSRSILIDGNPKKVFMKVLEKGDLVLYRNYSKSDRFYIENQELIPLTGDNFRSVLHSFTNCDTDAASSRLRYNRLSLSNYIRLYNSGKVCPSSPVSGLGLFGRQSFYRIHSPALSLYERTY